MHLSWRDGLATVFVGVGAALYGFWLTGVEVPGLASGRAIAAVVFGLGLAASVTAVVYGVGAGLLKAHKVYLSLASVIGLVAVVGGVIAVVTTNETMLAALVASTVALWLMSTIRHVATPTTRVHDDAIDDTLKAA